MRGGAGDRGWARGWALQRNPVGRVRRARLVRTKLEGARGEAPQTEVPRDITPARGMCAHLERLVLALGELQLAHVLHALVVLDGPATVRPVAGDRRPERLVELGRAHLVGPDAAVLALVQLAPVRALGHLEAEEGALVTHLTSRSATVCGVAISPPMSRLRWFVLSSRPARAPRRASPRRGRTGPPRWSSSALKSRCASCGSLVALP